jgi:hypothetical protein
VIAFVTSGPTINGRMVDGEDGRAQVCLAHSPLAMAACI